MSLDIQAAQLTPPYNPEGADAALISIPHSCVNADSL